MKASPNPSRPDTSLRTSAIVNVGAAAGSEIRLTYHHDTAAEAAAMVTRAHTTPSWPSA